MIHGPAFYKLLGIPESVAEPTAYDLLQVHPRAVTPARVDSALRERKARLRQNVPGPQFIPIVSMIEQELDNAAAILRDPVQRAAYNQRLLRNAKAQRRRRGSRERARLVRACRQAVQAMVDADGCLHDARRGELAARLSGLGLPADQVEYVLEHIPRPMGEPDATPTPADEQATGEGMAFFMKAIDLEVEDGLLTTAAEEKLLTMAQRFGIPPDVAGRRIDERLDRLGAQRGTGRHASLAGQLKLHILAMYPMGDATERDRQRLLDLAEAEGLSHTEAVKVLDAYLPASPATTAVDELGYPIEDDALGDLKALADGERAAPGRPARRGGARRLGADVAIGLVVAVLAVGAWRLIGPHFGLGRTEERSAVQGSGPAGDPNRTPASAPAPERAVEELVMKALSAAREPERLAQLFDDANAAVRDQALRQAAGLLMSGPTVREQAGSERLFKALLGCPPAGPVVQDAAVRALIDHLASTAEAGPMDAKQAYRGAALLAGVLLLRPTPGFTVTEPSEMAAFLSQCRQVWQESCRAAPFDPANDPKRLAGAVAGGGSLTAYAGRSDALRFSALASELAGVAADPAAPGSREAFAALLAAAGQTTPPREIKEATRLALCQIVEHAADPFVATRAQATLASALELAYDDALRSAALGTAAEREAAAAGFRRAIRAGGAAHLPVAPAATRPATAPVATRPAPVGGALAVKVRSTWTGGVEPRPLMTDLACTALACADRVGRFASGSDALTRELLDVLNEKDAALRSVRLTRHVVLAGLDEALGQAGASALSADLVARLQRDLQSNAPGVRYQAIEQLRVLGGPQAADLLIGLVRDAAASARTEYAPMGRALRALIEINDPTIPAKLAGLIEPARSNYVAHRIVMTLMEGTGQGGSVQRLRYELPVNHNNRERAAQAQLWENLAVSCPWGPRRLAGQIAGSVGPPLAWQPDPVTQKLLAAFVHHLDLMARMLKAYKPADPADAEDRPEIGPGRKDPAPVANSDLAEAVELLSRQWMRLARGHANARPFAVKLDMIALEDKARSLACETVLQEAAVRLDTIGKLLEVLVLESGPDEAAKATVAEARRQREAAVARAENVLDELRQHSYHNLVLLGLLPEGGP